MEEPAQQAPRGRVRILVSSSRLREAPPKGERAVRIGIEPAPAPHGIVSDRRRHLDKPEPRKEVADALRPETGTAEDPGGEVPRHTTGAESQSASGRPGRIGTECRQLFLPQPSKERRTKTDNPAHMAKLRPSREGSVPEPDAFAHSPMGC